MESTSEGSSFAGTPDQVADKLTQLYRSGVDAVLMIFLSFHDDTVRFGQDIVPLLRQLDVVKEARRT